jgi:hypothetical protein
LPYKDKDKRVQNAKRYGAQWYQRNREKTLARVSKRKKQKRKEWHDFKAGLSCLSFSVNSQPFLEITPSIFTTLFKA